MKHSITTILIAVLMSMIGVNVFAHDIAVANSNGVTIYYNWINNMTELSVSYQGSSSSDYSNEYTGSIIIPSSVVYQGNTYSVTSIGSSAFVGCSGLTSIAIPNSVASIHDEAFMGCSGLTSVIIPYSVTSIGYGVFIGCSSLVSVTIPSSMTYIGPATFKGCSSLSSVTIPNSVRLIGNLAFYNCTGLTKIISEIENPLIVDDIFSCNDKDIYASATLVVPPGKKSVYQNTDGWNLFSNIVEAELIGYEFESSGIRYRIGQNNTVSVISKKGGYYSGDVVIPSSVVYHGKTYSVTSIDTWAFFGCDNLTSVTIPNSVTTIGDMAFQECGLTSITIPNSVTRIGLEAFKLCNLTSVSIPNSVTFIAKGAFSDCRGLTSVTIPNSVTSIGDEAFYACSGLTSVTIPNSVTSIGDDAFSACSGLTSIIIPNSVTSIGGYAFSRCSSLSTVISEIENPFAIDNSVFGDIPSNATLIVPKGKKSIYQSTAGWNRFANIAESSGKCGADVYYSYNAETHTLTISGEGEMWGWQLVEIDDRPWRSFYKNIRSIVINSGVTSIDQWAFAEFISLTSVTIPSSVTTIYDCAFLGCSGLTSVTIPNGVIMIEDDDWGGAFGNCTGLTSIIIPNSVTSLGSLGGNTFRGCSNLTSIKVESGNQKYDSRDNCNAIIEKSSNTLISGCKNTIIPNSVTSIGYKAFRDCRGLTSVTIPNSVTSIGSSAFSGCSGLTSVTIPSSVTSIGGSAFSSCSSLTKIISEIENPFSISDNAFYYYDKDIYASATLVVPPGKKSIYQNTDGWKQFSNIVEAELIGYEFESGGIRYRIGQNNTVSIISKKGGYYSGDVVIPSSVVYHGKTYSVKSIEYAFAFCDDLTSVTIPNSVTSIGQWAFYESSLPSLTIPNSVMSIGFEAFKLCSLTSVTIPSSVALIGPGAFSDCGRLATVVSEMENPCEIVSDAFSYINANATLIVPPGTKSAYQSKAGWNKFQNIEESVGVTVTAISYSIVYGDALPIYGYISTGAALSGTPSISCSATAASPVGTYTITVSKGSVTNKYDSYVNGTLTINKAPLTVTAKNYIIKQGQALPTFEATYSGLKNSETSSVLTTQPSFSCSATSASEPGTYDIIVSGAAAQNYDISYEKGTLTIINADPVAVTANSYTITYGDALPTYGYTSIGAALSGTPSISCSATATSPAGTYPITISKGSVTNNNDIYVNGTLTINKAPLTITAKNYIIKQGESLPTFEATYSGFKNNETSSVLTTQPSFNCSATSGSALGTYDIIVSGAAAQNYNFIYVKGTLTITDTDPVAVTANSYTITYGDALPTYEYTSIGAALKGTPSVSCSATATSPAGIYPITISKGSVTNYNDIYVNGTLTINKAPLTITAKNYIIKQGESLPTFEATYSGFKNSETSSVLTTQPLFSCSATSASAPGTYDITISGAAAQNYSMSYVKGTLTITADDTPVLLGDANNDGVVDAADIVELVNAKAGHPSASFNLKNADANADGSFTEADITATADIIMKR